MAHIEIIIGSAGSGDTGSAKSEVRYTPADTVPPVLVMRKAKKAERVLEKLNDYLYGGGAYPLAGEDDED
jgi:hypothetical protein